MTGDAVAALTNVYQIHLDVRIRESSFSFLQRLE